MISYQKPPSINLAKSLARWNKDRHDIRDEKEHCLQQFFVRSGVTIKNASNQPCSSDISNVVPTTLERIEGLKHILQKK